MIEANLLKKTLGYAYICFMRVNGTPEGFDYVRYKYDINTVTDKDIEKPNLEGFEKKEY